MVRNATSMQHISKAEYEQQQDAPLIDATFINWQGEDFCGVNDNDPQIAIYTRSKKRSLWQ